MRTRYYVVFVIFSVLFLAAIAFGRWMRPYNLRTEQAAARAAGIPLNPAEFPQVAVTEDQNAAPIYLALGQSLKTRDLKETSLGVTWRTPNGSIPKAKTAALRALVDSRPDVERLVHSAIAKPHLFVTHVWSPSELFQYPAQLRTSAKWIRWESILLARQGRYVEAVKHQALGFRVAHQAAEDPVFISYLVGIACDGITMSGFIDILNEAGPNAEVAAAVRNEIAAYRPTYDLTRCLKGEEMLFLSTLRQLRGLKDVYALGSMEGAAWGASDRPANGLTRWFLLDPMEAIYLHWMTALIKASDGLPVERARTMEALVAEYNRTPRNKPTYICSNLIIPIFGRAGETEVDAMARRAAVTAMADVMEYRARHGRWPSTLPEAGSPVPVDPRTRMPVGYRHEGSGFVISTHVDATGPDSDGANGARQRFEIHYPPLSPAAKK